MANTANYTIDKAGNMVSVGGGGMVPLAPSNPIGAGQASVGLAPTPQSSDPYTIFNSKLADLLVTAQKQSAANNTLFGGAKDALLNESVAPNGPQPFNPGVFSGSQVQGQETLQQSFNPAITSISTQEANTAAAMAGVSDTIGKLQAATQPLELAPGQSLVTRDGTVLKAGHSYTPSLNPVTGLMDGFDQNTGSWASSDNSSGAVTKPPTTNSDPVGGVDFSGASTSTKPYATDPNYAVAVDSMYHQISKAQPLPTAPGFDQFITSHVGGKSPVTGQMIMTAATQYSIDPNILAAVLGHESDFGTAGAGAKTMNAGNVGNTGTSTTNFPSWQQGVNAAAYEIARRMPGNPNAKAPSTTSPVGGQFSGDASQKIAQLPESMHAYVDTGPLGLAYINSDKVPDALKPGVQTQAARAGIPFAVPSDVNAIKSIETVLNNLDSMQKLADENLNNGVTGHIKDTLLGGAAQKLQTDWGIKLGLFDNYRDTAIKAVQALAGGAGSGLRINGAEIAANTQNLPQASDSKENAIAQIRQLRQLIYTQLVPTFPYVKVRVQDPNGQMGSMPVGNLNAAIQKGYTVL